MKRIVALILSVVCLLSMVACRNDVRDNEEIAPQYSVTAEDANVWCVEPFVQVLANLPAEDYAEQMIDKISIHSAKNEFETAQIVVSAKKDLKFTVSVSDLIHTQDSGAIISGENCTVYTIKYIGIVKNYHANGAPTGDYPDALLPQENAIKYEQNVVKAGKNGGAWLSFFTPKDAKPGEYTGKATVDLGQEQVQVDISLTVYDVAIPDETTSKSLFTVNETSLKMYELDSTEAISDKYIQFLINHRSAPSHFNIKEELREEGDSQTMAWARTAYYWYEKGLRTFAYFPGTATVDGYAFFNTENLTNQMIDLAKIGLEKGINLSARSALYDFPIDEPFYVKYSAEHVQNNIDKFNECVANAVTELEKLEEFDSDLGKEIIESVRKIPHIVTDYIGDEFRVREPLIFQDGTPLSYEGQNVAVCPKFDGYGTEEMRQRYNLVTCEEKWWYGCNGPNYPYPSYHIDDSPVTAAVLGWMMAEFGVTGNLYWVINYYQVGGQIVEDPYTLADWGSGANGDGDIVFPGKQYGVDGPVGTVRMQAILDGNEDYELIKEIQKQYTQKGISADGIIHRITSSVYTNSKVLGGIAEYEEARQILLSVAQAADSDSQLMIESVEEQFDADGRKTYTVSVKTTQDSQLYYNGELMSGENGTYNIVCRLSEAKNYLNLKAVANESEIAFSIYLGGMQLVYSANEFTEQDFTGNFTSMALVDGIYKMQFAEEEKAKISFEHESIQHISSDTSSYIVKLQNYGTEASYKLYVTYADFGRVEFSSGNLVTGENELNLDNFSTVNWERNGELVAMELVVSGTDSIGITQIIVYGK